MDTQKKPVLGTHIQKLFHTKYGSIAAACEALGLVYEGVKRSLQRNALSAELLGIIFPGYSLDQLKREFEFKLARRNKPQKSIKRDAWRGDLHYFLQLISEQDRALIVENKILAEKITRLIQETCEEFRKFSS